MITDAEPKDKGLRTLSESLEPLETERFVALLSREDFDYTEWRNRTKLFEGLTVRELSAKAMAYHKEHYPSQSQQK